MSLPNVQVRYLGQGLVIVHTSECDCLIYRLDGTPVGGEHPSITAPLRLEIRIAIDCLNDDLDRAD